MTHTIVLSLISHTNVGKTTLTRTLLRRDVGEVRDEAHVTVDSERFVMLGDGEEALILWDTPGFGPVTKILKRLDQEGGALGWIAHEVIDRVFDRALYSSLEAARNVRAEADVVLYLVNARENPEDAGYVRSELRLLDALKKPVVLILNQVAGDRLANISQIRERWAEHYGDHSCLRQVILLDAFSRSWLQELRLLDEIAPYLDDQKQRILARLRTRFISVHREVFKACAGLAGETLWFAAHQTLTGSEKGEQIFQRLMGELQAHLDRYIDLLVSRHHLEAVGRARLEADIEQVTGLMSTQLEEKKTGFLAGAVASAGTGLMADILSGGLTFGGGMILGFLGGALGGFSYARLMNFINRNSGVAWKEETLGHFYRLLLSYYLLAALHGRGKGKLELDEVASFLSESIDDSWDEMKADVEGLISTRVEGEKMSASWSNGFVEVFDQHVRLVLGKLYPELEKS